MRRPSSLLPAVFTLLALALLSGGCSLGRQSPPTRLYVLTALPETDDSQRVASTAGVALAVGPVRLPEYVDRPQIVTGDSGNELQQAALAQWAEPLTTNFTRVLAANLSVLLRTDRVAVFPWRGSIPIDYQVVIEVMQLLGAREGSVSLVALWRVLGKDGREVLVSRQARFTEATGSQDYGALAAAMSRTVASLSREIAAAITALPQQALNTAAK